MRKFWVGVNIALYLFTQISDDEYELGDPCIYKLVDDDAEDGLACYGYQCFRLCIGEGAKFGTCSCYRNNGFHDLCIIEYL